MSVSMVPRSHSREMVRDVDKCRNDGQNESKIARYDEILALELGIIPYPVFYLHRLAG